MKAPAFEVDRFLARLTAMGKALAARGFPPDSQWWSAATERWFRALAQRPGRLRQWAVRAGRRAGKSTKWCKIAVAWGLYGPWAVPSGDVGVVALISVSRDEAAQRLRTIAAILDALGVGYDTKGDSIELRDRPCVFKVFTCSSTAVGHTSILIIGDEVAKWENRDRSANPAAQVCGSQRPTLATQPWGFMILSSSPWTRDDFHAQQYDLGDTEFQLTSFAETWIANDSLTEAETHALEPDQATWLREYAAQPSDSTAVNWFGAAVDNAIDFGPPQKISFEIDYTIAVDPKFSGTTADLFGGAVVSSQAGDWDSAMGQRKPRVTRVHETFAWPADRSPRDMALRVRNEICVKYHARKVFSDQWEGRSWTQLAKDVGLNVVVVPWTGGDGDTSKSARFRAVRTSMLQGELTIPNDADLIRELRSVRGILTPSGNERIEVVRTAAGHGDRVSAAVLASSIALARGAQLPPSRLTWQEEEQHDRARARLEGWDPPNPRAYPF